MTWRFIDNQNRQRWAEHQGKRSPYFRGVPDGFSWINQGGATVTRYMDHSVELAAPAGINDNWRVREIATPTVPYQSVLAFWPVLPTTATGGEDPACAVGWRENGSGKLALFRIYYDGTNNNLFMDYAHWTSPTVLSAVQVGPVSPHAVGFGSAVWVRLRDDSTNRHIDLSPDGISWLTDWWLEGRTTFLTADRLVFACNADNAFYPAAMRLLDFHLEN